MNNRLHAQRKRLACALGGVLVLAAIGAATLTYHPDARAQSAVSLAAAAPQVDVANVVVATITDFQRYSGRIEAIDKVDIRPLAGGTIVAVHFKDGSLVHKGDPLFTIDPRPYAAEVDRASAASTRCGCRPMRPSARMPTISAR